MEPRCVLLTRPTPWEELVARHGTPGQAAWFLERQGRAVAPLLDQHERQARAVDTLWRAIPSTWRQTRLARSELDRFLFEPDDLVVAVGQDGLVANVAKYLDRQPVLGVHAGQAGVLVPHAPPRAAQLLARVGDGTTALTERTRVQAVTDDGQRLLALNEIFVGHRTHQSARYTLDTGGRTERQSSSGVIVATGTGCTGWARSIATSRKTALELPDPAAPRLVFFVREPWPSRDTGVSVAEGLVDDGGTVEVLSEMNDGGVMFGDGIESDLVELPFARRVILSRAAHGLRVV